MCPPAVDDKHSLKQPGKRVVANAKQGRQQFHLHVPVPSSTGVHEQHGALSPRSSTLADPMPMQCASHKLQPPPDPLLQV